MEKNLFLTGFPGFIAKRLISELLSHAPNINFHFLIQASMEKVAQAASNELDSIHPGFKDKAKLYVGDITETNLGLSEEEVKALSACITDVWHLAAIYDLATDESIAYNVNVVGTKHVLDFAETCTNLNRMDYVSTCYVSGKRSGTIMENDIDQNQEFKNHYESTKCWAELEVRKKQATLPIAIHRPSIVMGDSQSGETDKYDGPYYLIQLLMRLPRWIPMVNIGAGKATPNLVPVDYVVSTMAQIWSDSSTTGKTFALADPNPHTARDIIKTMIQSLNRTRALGSIPSKLMEVALSSKFLRRAVRIPKEAIIYFNHDVTYDTTNTQAVLAKTNIKCPDFLETLPILIQYVENHPKKTFLDGRKI